MTLRVANHPNETLQGRLETYGTYARQQIYATTLHKKFNR